MSGIGVDDHLAAESLVIVCDLLVGTAVLTCVYQLIVWGSRSVSRRMAMRESDRIERSVIR